MSRQEEEDRIRLQQSMLDTKITVDFEEMEGFCREQNRFRVTLGELGTRDKYKELHVEVVGPEHIDLNHKMEDGGRRINFMYRACVQGIYRFSFSYMGVQAKASSYSILIKKQEMQESLEKRQMAAENIYAFGRGLRYAALGMMALFSINTRLVKKSGDGPLMIYIDFPDGTTVCPLTYEINESGAEVGFISTQEGLVIVRITWDGVPIIGSPFLVHCTRDTPDLPPPQFNLYNIVEEQGYEFDSAFSSAEVSPNPSMV